MDAALVVLAVATLTSSTKSAKTQSSLLSGMRSSVGVCSYGLFSLSVLETTPSGWFLFSVFTRQEKSSTVIPWAYRVILTSLAVLVLVVHPTRIAYQLFGTCSSCTQQQNRQQQQISMVDEEDLKKKMQQVKRVKGNHHQFTRCSSVCAFFIKRLYCCVRLAGRQPRTKTTTLVMTKADLEELDHGNSSPKATNNTRQKLASAVCGTALTIAILHAVAPMVIRIDSTVARTTMTSNTQHHVISLLYLLLTTAVSWMCAVGILISAILNGMGSVWVPYAYCFLGNTCSSSTALSNMPISQAITAAELELLQAQESLEQRKQERKSPNISISWGNATNIGNSASTTTTTMSTTPLSVSTAPTASFGEMGENVAIRKKQLSLEVQFLETLVKEIEQDVQEMRQFQQLSTANARTTFTGRVRYYTGVVFSIVLLVKLFGAISVLWSYYHRVHGGSTEAKRRDVVTMSLVWLLGHEMISPKDLNTLSQLVSLGLTAILSVSQIRSFLQMAHAVSRRLQKVFHQKCCSSVMSCSGKDLESSFVRTNGGRVYTQVVSSLMGCYFVACIVLTKLLLPEEYRYSIITALSGHDYHLHHHHDETNHESTMQLFRIRPVAVQMTFCMAAAVSVLVLSMLWGIQRQNTLRYLQQQQHDMWCSSGGRPTTRTSPTAANGNMEP